MMRVVQTLMAAKVITGDSSRSRDDDRDDFPRPLPPRAATK